MIKSAPSTCRAGEQRLDFAVQTTWLGRRWCQIVAVVVYGAASPYQALAARRATESPATTDRMSSCDRVEARTTLGARRCLY